MSTHPALRLGLFADGFNAGMLVVNMGFSQAQAVASDIESPAPFF